MSEPSTIQQAERVCEVTFETENSAYPFVRVSEWGDCVFELAKMVPRGDGQYAEFFNVTGVDPERVLALVDEFDAADVTLLDTYGDGGLFEFLVSGYCPAYALAELGAIPRDVRGEDGHGRIRAEIPRQYDPATVVEAFLAEYDGIDLVSKHEKESVGPLFTESAFGQVVRQELTDRQAEVLQTAFEAGYYEWPRDTTGQNVADRLGISSATFSEHIHAAERKLIGRMLSGVSNNGDGCH